VVPLVSLVRGRRSELAGRIRTADDPPEASDDVDAALDRLRDRYARGDLSDEQFERKLEALLETETPEDARARVEQTAKSDARDDTDREFEWDR
jgi:hypothetical protein